MSELKNMIADSVSRLLSEQVTPALREAFDRGEPLDALWQLCADAGLDRVLATEAHGGAGAQPSDAFAVVDAVGRHAVGLGLADTVVANWMLSAAGIAPPEGTVALIDSEGAGGMACAGSGTRRTLAGSFTAVPWAGRARWGVATGTDGDGQAWVGLLRLDDATRVQRRPRPNIANEPAADLLLDAAPFEAFAQRPAHAAVFDARHAGALARSVQSVGALERVLALSVRYAGERVQFGKPIGKNQAVQQALAALAGQVASARAAALAAWNAMDAAPSAFDIAVAKVRSGEAAGVAAATAHQVHGAIGFTQEHELHFFTRRLWSWRAEFGSDSWWALQLGRQAIAAGAARFWPSIVARGDNAAGTLAT